MKQLLLTLLLHLTHTQYVFTQLGQNIEFFRNTPQVRTPVNLGPDFRSTKQYSVWGWIKFKGKQPSIMNILNIHNDQTIINNDQNIGPFPNPKFPTCPFSREEILKNSNLQNSPLVINNPNCNPQVVDSNTLPSGTIQTKLQDILYINYDLKPENGSKTFDLTFLVQNGKKVGKGEMKIEGFVDIEFGEEAWGFFAISCDYTKGLCNIYFKIFNSLKNNSFFKTFQIDFQQFSLNKDSTFTLASVEKNNFFDSVSGYQGNIAYVEMSSFYTSQLDTLWTGYMTPQALGYNGNLMSIDFEMYNKSNSLQSTGLINNNYQVEGNFETLFEENKNKLGIRFLSNSFVDLGEVDLNNQDLIKGMLFWFKLKYKEDLDKDYTLLTRGKEGENGFLRISLQKQKNGRLVKIETKGSEESSQSSYQFISNNNIKEDEVFYFLAGNVNSPNGASRVVYIDSYGQKSYDLIGDDYNFDTSPQQIVLFNNSDQQKGYVDALRFKILNSGSSSELINQINKAEESDKFNFKDNCNIRSSYYINAFECFECEGLVLTDSKFCENFCKEQTKNPLSGKCTNCLEENCKEIDLTTWKVEQLGKQRYRFRPTRKILNNFINYDDINVKFDKNFDYDVKKTVNSDEQYVDFDFKFKESIIDENLSFSLIQSEQNKLFDQNRNLLLHSTNKIEEGVEINTVTSRICYVKSKKRNFLKALALIALIIFAISLLFVILLTIFFCNKMTNLGAIWKFLLHNWMRLQLISFFLFLGIYQPCCVKEFLKWIYKFTVQWNHAFRPVIDNIYDSNSNYIKTMESQRPPEQFYERDVRSFILHNIFVLFIVQLIVFFFYIILKIWDCFVTSGASCFYRVFVFLQYSGLISCYLIMHMQISVFSGLNFRKAKFNHFYFVICFLVCICYLSVFIIFWIYSLIKILGSSLQFMDQLVKNEFYYFYSGYRDDKYGRTWDHWMTMCHLIIGLAIGILYNSALTQSIIIVIVLIVLLGITILLKPWRYNIFNILEIVAQILILFVAILYLIISAFDKRECFDCGGREGVLCWLIVMCLFFAIVLPALGLILQGIRSCVKPEVEEYEGGEMMENQYIEQQQINTNENIDISQNVIVNRNIDINNNYEYQEVKEQSMGQFMNQVKGMNEGEGRSPNELAPDSADEELIMPRIMRALTANNSFTSDAIEESRMELDQKKKYLNKQKMNFYENKISQISDERVDPYYYDPYKNSNLVSGKFIEERVITQKKSYSEIEK